MILLSVKSLFKLKRFLVYKTLLISFVLDKFVFYDDLFAMKLIMRSQLRFNSNFIQCNVSRRLLNREEKKEKLQNRDSQDRTHSW